MSVISFLELKIRRGESNKKVPAMLISVFRIVNGVVLVFFFASSFRSFKASLLLFPEKE